MAIRAYEPRSLALVQLETALCLYFDGNDYASVITLAGAADVMFGKLLASVGRESSLEALKRAVTAIQMQIYGESLTPSDIADRANLARNVLKHWSASSPDFLKLDLFQEACDMLNRAIDNYWLLEQTLTPSMEKFQREIMAA